MSTALGTDASTEPSGRRPAVTSSASSRHRDSGGDIVQEGRRIDTRRIVAAAGAAVVVATALAGAALAAGGRLPALSAGQASPQAAVDSRLPAAQVRRLAAETGVPAPFWRVDPRTARSVDLGQPLTTNAPIFPGDPAFHWRVVATVPADGFLLEQITSLGTHTGTHVSAPCHFHERTRCLAALPERFFAPRPLVVLHLRAAIARRGGDFFVTIRDLRRFEERHGRIPRGGYVVLFTGLSAHWRLGNTRRPGALDDYFDDVPGFSGRAVAWLFEERGILGVGADTFGPDATFDESFGATTAATGHGGITLENLGPGVARMRPYGDWIAVNGPRFALAPNERRAGTPGWSGAQMGITGFTRWAGG
jgi:kynurenine formamidase